MRKRTRADSASPRREELLRQIGIIPEVIPSEIEEKVTEKEPDRE